MDWKLNFLGNTKLLHELTSYIYEGNSR